MSEPTSAIVPVKSAWLSKINWAAGIGLFAAVLSIWNIDLSADLQTTILRVFTDVTEIIIPAVIILFRTKFTKTVTPSSVSDAVVVDQKKSVASETPPGPVVRVADVAAVG